MSPAWIRRREQPPTGRKPKGSRSYQVLYRRGGRHFKIETAGTFPSERLAKLRRDLIAGWLAQGLDPKLELAKLLTTPVVVTYRKAQDTMITSRVDVDETTLRGYKSRGQLLNDLIGDRAVQTLTEDDGVELVAALVAHETRGGTMSATSIASYIGQARMVLDFAKVKPNPFRDQLVRLPKIVQAHPAPPTAAEVEQIAEKILAKYLVPLAVLETTGMRVGELRLPWGDVDTLNDRFRLTREATKTNRPRWVQIPGWLMDVVEATCAPEDRTELRPVFPGITDAALRTAMARACRLAGQVAYSPHDLRHRRISLWHGQGLAWREIADRVGHVRASQTLDTYSHVMPLDELSQESWERLLVRSP